MTRPLPLQAEHMIARWPIPRELKIIPEPEQFEHSPKVSIVVRFTPRLIRSSGRTIRSFIIVLISAGKLANGLFDCGGNGCDLFILRHRRDTAAWAYV